MIDKFNLQGLMKQNIKNYGLAQKLTIQGMSQAGSVGVHFMMQNLCKKLNWEAKQGFVRKYSKSLIHIIINMLTQQIVEQQAENRRSQRTLIPLKLVLQRLNKQDYENLIQWMFEVNLIFIDGYPIIFFTFLDIMQNSDYLKLSCSTKFLARTFFDASILEPEVIPYDHNIALALAALSLAIKFNETRQLSEQLTLQALLKSVDIYLSKISFLCLQAKVMRSVSYVFRYTTPNDYLEIFMEKFPYFPSFRKAIPKFIQLAMMRPGACQFMAQEIFYGAVIALIQIHKPQLTQYQNYLLNSLTNCWEKAKLVAQSICQAIFIVENTTKVQ